MATKIASLAIRTLAKPLSNGIKNRARDNEGFRRFCIGFAQRLHRIDMRMRLGLLQDPAVIDKQVRREQEELDKLRNPAHAAGAKTKEEAEAEEKEKEDIKKRLKNTKRKIKPLSESKAIDTGATFISESFLFLVAAGLIFGEQWYSRRKTQKGNNEVEQRLKRLEGELSGLKTENSTLKEEIILHQRTDGAVGAKIKTPSTEMPPKQSAEETARDCREKPSGGRHAPMAPTSSRPKPSTSSSSTVPSPRA